MGSLACGPASPKRMYLHMEASFYQHDPNLTLNILMRVIADTARKRQAAGKSVYVKTLYLQMDNCVRECKNKYVLAFCQLLVEWGIFDKVS